MGSGGSIFRRRGLSSALAFVTALVTFVVAGPAPAQAANLFVDNSNIAVVCDDGTGAPFCTVAAAVNSAGDNDTIQVAAGTYPETATIQMRGKNLTLIGAGSGSTIIDRTATPGRVMNIFGAFTYSVTGVTITGGNSGGSMGAGVAIAPEFIDSPVGPQVTMTDVAVTNNASTSNGGGIELNQANLIMNDSLVDGNSSGASGGGIYVYGTDPELTVFNSVVSNNVAVRGAGLAQSSGTVTIDQSAISRNSVPLGAGQGGGGLYVTDLGGVVTNTIIGNTTVTENFAGGQLGGGGIYFQTNLTSSHVLNNVTITNNFTDDGGTGTGNGGGGLLVSNDTPLTISNSVIAGNLDLNGGAPDCRQLTSAAINSIGNNFIGDNTFCGAFVDGANGDQVGTTGAVLDPMLTPVETPLGILSYEPMLGSPLIDAGSTVAVGVPGACEPVDQNGVARFVGLACDIGSIEFASATPLQDMIDLADPGDDITVPAGTYNERIIIGDGKTLQALPGTVTIDATGLGGSAVTAGNGDFGMDGITITGGNSPNQGGGIHADGGGHTVTLIDVIVDGNNAVLDGAGIWIDAGNTLNVIDSVLSNNTALGDGGAIYSNGAAVTVTDSTISDNESINGGGIAALDGSTLTITGSAVDGNFSTEAGGGVWVADLCGECGLTSASIANSTISSNGSDQGGGVSVEGGADLLVVDSTIELNSGVDGAGIKIEFGNAVLQGVHLLENATAVGLGGGIYSRFASVTIEDSETRSSLIDSNTATQGAGIMMYSDDLVVSGATISNNSGASGAGINVADCGECSTSAAIADTVITGNAAATIGGGLRVQNNVSLTLTASTVDANTASDGAGLNLSGAAVIDGSVFSNNDATGEGGAIYSNGSLTLSESTVGGSTIDGNSAAAGGGLYLADFGTFSISDSTISNNTASSDVSGASGGIYADVQGEIVNSTISGNTAPIGGTGGIHAAGDGTVLDHVTITNNSAAISAGGVTTSENSVLIFNSIVAENSVSNLDEADLDSQFVTSGGHNVIGIDDGANQPWLANDQVGTFYDEFGPGPLDPLLGDLADNGGPTFTHALLFNSPAIDEAFPPAGFTTFNVGANIESNGSASLTGGRLRLTNGGDQAGTGFWRQPVRLDGNGFSTTFDFQITNPVQWIGAPDEASGDGLTFVIADSPSRLGLDGGRIGIGNVVDTVVVEFDTFSFQAPGFDNSDPDATGNGYDHVGIDIDGNMQSSTVFSQFTGHFDDGAIWTATVNYNGTTNELAVTVTNGVVVANVDTIVDIASVVGNGDPTDPVYFGFSSGTGAASATHEILNWSGTIEGQCPPTDQRGESRPFGPVCDVGAFELQDDMIPTELKVKIDQLAAPVGSSVIPITDLNVGTFFGATDGPSSTQLGAIQLGAIQLGAIQLGAIGLADAAGHMTIGSIINAANEITAAASPTVIPTILDTVTLVDIPVVGGWDPILAGTSLAGRPSYTVTLQQVIDELVDLNLLRDLRIAESGVTASQLGAIQLGAIQLGAIQLDAIQLGAIQLGAIGDQLTALCAGDLDCAALGINPSNSNSYDDFSVMALTLMGVDLDFAQLGAIQLGAIDPEGTQLGAIQLGAIQLGAIDLNALTIGNTQLGAIQLGAIQLGAIQLGAIGGPPGGTPALVTQLCASGLDCAELGIDPAGPFAGDELDGYSLLALGAMGANLESTQLGAIQLGAIQLGAIGDLESTQLGAIQLGAIQLGAIDPASTQLGAIQLGAIGPSSTQLGAIQLGAIDFNNPVFAQLGAIQLGAIQLGAIATSTQLGAIQLGAIQLGAIANGSAIISCGSLVGGCSGNGLMTLLELQRLGLILPTATLADLAEAIGDIPLSDLAGAGLDIVALVGTATLLDLLPETTIAELPPELTLGQLAELWVGMPVFELLLALLNPGELGWEDVDPAVLAAQHPAVTGWSVDFTLAGEEGAVDGAEFPFTAEATVNLPSGMAYIPGSAQISIGGGSATLLSDPEQEGNTLQWVIDGLTLNSSRVITFDLGTAFTADTTTPVATTINTLGYTATDTAPTIVLDVEPNDTFGTATPVGGDVVVLGRIGTETDVDMFKINVPPGATIEAYLNPGGVDLDLVLFEPGLTTDGELRGPAERIVDGSLDPTIGIDPVEQDQESLADIANTDLAPVFKASLHRSTANEAIVTPPLREGGDFYLQISGYNGATPDSVYVSRIRVIDPPAASACAARPLADPGSWQSPTLPSGVGVETLYLMNTELFRDTFGDADTDSVLNAIALVQGVPGVPTGVVVPVEGDNDVADAYDAWLDAAGNCSVDRANDVASAIGALVDDYRASNPDIANIVIVGGDDQIPFFRVKDQGVVANEREYRSTFTGNNPLVASLGDGTVLTDAPYSDPNPLYVPQGDREVFIPQLPTGRLVDQPEEIIGALAQFVAASGKLETVVSTTNPAPTAQVLGYDFLSDSSATIAGSLADQGFGVTSVVNETWDKSALKAAMDSTSAIVNVNAHFDHTAALPAAGNLTNTFTDLYQLDDLLPTTSSAYEGKIIFSMGCHAGLNAADSYLAAGDPAREWAQELLVRDAVFVGNTGFGYGDSDFEAYSEALMSLFAQKIETSNTIGEAFVAAQQTLAGKTPKWSPYHDKSQMEATLYGLPFYQLHATPVTATTPATFPTSPVGGTGLQSLTTSAVAALTQETTTDGDYLVGDDVLAVPFRPVQPLELINVTPTNGGLRATGAIIEGGTSVDLVNFDVLYARPILYNELAEPETETTGAFPNALQAITSFETPGGTIDQLLLARGRYFPSTRTQQRWDTMDLTVYYVPDSVIDVAPPTISRVSAVEVTAGQVNFEVEADDASGVVRVVVLYKTAGTSGAWTKLELTSTGGPWTGNAALTAAQNVDFFVQVLGGDGQVAVSTDKAELHQVQPPGPPTIQVVSGTVGNNGIYKSPVGVALNGPANAPGAELEYSEDGSEFATYTGQAITLADGTHSVKARPALAPTSVVTRIVVVDSTAPTVTVANPTAPGVKLELNSTVPLQYFCADTGGSGIAKCKGTVGNGAPLPTETVGLHVAQVTATDKAGNTHVALVPYEVVAEEPMTLTSDVSLVPVDTIVTFTATYSNTGSSHTVEWDFDNDGSSDTPASSTSTIIGDDEVTVATFTYASTGVFPVTATVTHETGYVQTQVLQYIVVYDPAEGFVTGGGWFDSPSGAYTPGDSEDPDIVGKAKFGFVSKYKKGASVPTGNTKFELKAGDLDFRSTAYEWMVISGKKAQYKGVGTVEGWEGEFNFRLTAMDADINPNDQFDVDTFRIEIWRSGNGPHFVLYDNGKGADPTGDLGTTEIGGGSIKIHSGKTKK